MFGNAIKEVDLLPQASVWTSALTGNEPLGNNPILCIEPTALLLELVIISQCFPYKQPQQQVMHWFWVVQLSAGVRFQMSESNSGD